MKRWLGAGLALLLALAAVFSGLALLALVVPRAPSVGFAPPGPGEASVVVVLAANPIHTDILLPATPALLTRFGFLARDGLPLDDPRVGAIAVGWGGRAFYTQTPEWRDLSLDALWRSFTYDRSVLHLSLAPALAGTEPGLRPVTLSEPAYEALLRFVEASFEPDPTTGGPWLLPGFAYSPYDRFYEARGGFNLLFGCNTWTAEALRHAGLRTSLWSPLPPLLLWGLDLHAA
ncbi:TIGR02117 family protein [Aureimonas sp. AU40]|uniref:TIGR02117 family protein n=1 Tax=Aureimonas sp. AU40 TaxID=1637747 RepID=UPI0009E6CAA8|nr:TIGR02117 family protein [Aureimonas sp. AU40]